MQSRAAGLALGFILVLYGLPLARGSTGELDMDDPPFSANVRLNDIATNDQNEVSMAVDTKGNIVAGWNDNRLGNSTDPWNWRCAYTSSQDGGRTWSANEVYVPEGTRQCGDPVVVADRAGNIYRLGMGMKGNISEWMIGISKTSDGGRSWGPWRLVRASDKPWLEAHQGRLYLLYSENGLQFRRSPDDGVTWDPPMSIGDGIGACIVADARGDLYASWGPPGNLREVKFRKSTDGGDTWSAEVVLGPGTPVHGTPRAGALTGCDVTADGNHVYVTWGGDGDPNNDDIFVVHSGDGGSTWTKPAMANDDTNAARNILPWVAVDEKGTGHVVWVDDRNGGGETWYSNSSDGGRTWSKNIRVSDAPPKKWVAFIGDYISVRVTPRGEVAAAWCDNRDGKGDVFFAAAPLGAVIPTLSRIEIWPRDMTMAADQTVQFSAEGYDQNGERMNSTFAWSANGGSIDGSGLYTPDKVGKYEVAARSGSIEGRTSITVTPGMLTRIAVEPAHATITADDEERFSASGYDAKRNPVNVKVGWTASGGQVDATGRYTPAKTGAFTVTATSGALSASAQVEVTPGMLAFLTLTPPVATIEVGETFGFSLAGADAKGNDLPGMAATWGVVDQDVGSVDPAGRFTGHRPGTTSVSVSVDDGRSTKTASAVVTVTARPDPPEPMSWAVLVLAAVVMTGAIALAARRRKKRKAIARHQARP